MHKRKSLIVIILLIFIKFTLHLYKPRGLLAYLVPSILWSLLALIVLWASQFRNLFSYSNKILSVFALIASIFQIVLLIDGGIFTKFGKSPVSFTLPALSLNALMISTSLLGIELSRAYLLRTYGRKNPLLLIMLTALLYSPILAMISLFIPPIEPLLTVKFLGSTFLTELSKNMLASYLALLAGPLASIAYMLPLRVFQWFSPILPDLPWGIKSLIGVTAPMISLIVIDYATPIAVLRKVGIRVEKKWLEKGDNPIIPILIVLIVLLIVWFSTGLLGIFPTVVISGSMRPTINVGDIVILVKVPTEEIKPGDIIQYLTKNGMILHRVIDIKSGYFITKGDACSVPDPDPVHPLNVRGKLLMVIPKIGWASIYVKEILILLWNLITLNSLTLYVAFASLILGGSLYTFRRSKSLKKYRRKRKH